MINQSRTPPKPLCQQHGEKDWCECWQCGGEGVSGHDCGEDCCVCLHPEDNERCDICSGKGGWWRCYTCAPMTEDEETHG
jgi:hypothetical protein